MALGRQGELVEAIAQKVLNSVPSPWKALAYKATHFTGYAESEVLVTRVDGSVVRSTPPHDLPDRELRADMYRERSGTWFSMAMVITPDGRASTSFNYTEEPPADGELNPWLFEDDLARFPRDDAHMPDWLRAWLDLAAKG